MSDSHFDKLMAILDRQSDDRVHPNMLVGYLGLINLMSIMSVVHSTMELTSGEIPVNTGNDLKNLLGDEKNLTNTLATLMSKAGGGTGSGTAPTGGGPDISNLLGMLGGGGNKKLNPQMLLTMMNLMNAVKSKSDSVEEVEAPPKAVAVEKEVASKTTSSEGKVEKKRLL